MFVTLYSALARCRNNLKQFYQSNGPANEGVHVTATEYFGLSESDALETCGESFESQIELNESKSDLFDTAAAVGPSGRPRRESATRAGGLGEENSFYCGV